MYYNLQKAADVLGLSTGEVNRLREQGKLRAYKDGADWKFRKEEVDKLAADMIRERSKVNNDGLLSTEDDEEKTTFADSSAFDTMFDQAGNDLQISLNEQKADAASVADSAEDAFNLSLEGEDDAFELAPESDSAAPAQEDDGLTLAEEPADDGLTLAEEPKEEDGLILSSEDSALAEDVKVSGSDSGSGLSLAGDSGLELLGSSDSDSGSGLNLSTGDSGLELLDEVGASDVDLAGGDLVLGGSGSGSGLNLNSGDSGLELMSDSDGGFELDQASEDLSLAEEEPSKEDGSVFELATDSDAAVLNLDKDADSEAATELAPEESVFQLSDQTLDAGSTNPSESMSSGVFSVEEKSSETTNPFVTDDGLAEDPTPAATSSGDSQSESRSIDVEEASSDAASLFTTTDDSNSPFGDASSPFGVPEPAGDASPFGGLSFDKANSGADDGFGAADFGATPTFGAAGGDEPSFSAVDTGAGPAMGGGTVPSTQFVGKDLIFLVPCFIFLLLATIGACELCRTIWSYEQGSFDLGGPVLEAIAKMVNLM
ncbi:MAG: helix-turn-helix domain-containing protein [Planctomycetia bacterium]|nr:helix-turn-helix domain-containing protein [Planctomycetia bacterium]